MAKFDAAGAPLGLVERLTDGFADQPAGLGAGRFIVLRYLRLWPVYAVCLGAGYALMWDRPSYAQFLWLFNVFLLI